MFFLHGIFGRPRALSSTRGEGFSVGTIGLLLLLLPGGPLRAAPPSASGVDAPDDSVAAAGSLPDSIRYVFPPFLVEDRRWNAREVRSELPVTVVGVTRLNARAAMGLGEALSGTPGLYVHRSGGAGSPSFVTIRGASSQQILVLLNGLKMNTAQGGGIDLSMLSPREIDRVEIYRGANSARWSGESIGGVLNVVTAEPDAERLRVRTQGGSRGARSLGVAAGFGGGMHFDVAARARAGSGDFDFRDPRRDGQRRRVNADFRGRSLSGTLEGRAGGGRSFRVHVSGVQNRRGAPGPIEFPTPEARLDDDRLFLQATVGDSSGALHWSIASGLHRLDRRYRNPDPVLWADDRHVNTGASATGDFTRAAGPATIEGGGVLERDILSSTTDGDRGRSRAGVWFRARFGPTPPVPGGEARSSVTPGFRIEKTGGYVARFLPSISGRLSLLKERLVLRGSAAQKYRTPSFDELFWPLSSGASGDPDLRPERSTGFEVSGTAYLFARRLRLRATGFHRRLTDQIEWAPGAQGIWRPHNVGRALERGLELETGWSGRLWRRFPPISAELSRQWLRATDEGSDPTTRGGQLIRRPVATSTASLEVFPARRLSADLSWSRVGRRYLTRSNSKWTDPYDVLDVGVHLSLWEGGDLHLSLENLLDRNYYDLDDFPVPGRTFGAAFDVSLR